MSRITITPRFVLDYTVGRYHGQVEVVTKDIGATIGTEILDENGVRICSYKPGTRYSDRAEEIAEEHLRKALELWFRRPLKSVEAMEPKEAVAFCLRVIVADEQPWNPDEEEADPWL
ncbi:recombinase family protein [Streptomyces californicus]|uniref:hypothetical protein n=1 Tax=Streptomyces californicus TaxID=67351 RepID=UPI0004BFCABC|nr:hypothetical protein [Streptomyces californicus]QRV53478.1 hypothetical protein I6J40_04155 [Streptomyces californicus]